MSTVFVLGNEDVEIDYENDWIRYVMENEDIGKVVIESLKDLMREKLIVNDV